MYHHASQVLADKWLNAMINTQAVICMLISTNIYECAHMMHNM